MRIYENVIEVIVSIVPSNALELTPRVFVADNKLCNQTEREKFISSGSHAIIVLEEFIKKV